MIKIHLVSPIETVVTALAIALVRTPTSVWFSIARHLTQVWVVARWQPGQCLVKFEQADLYLGTSGKQDVTW